MDYFELMLKMLRTFHMLHRTLLEDFRNSDFDTNLNKTQRRIIMHLYKDGEHTMSSLCKKTELQKGSMTTVIDRLEELNLVKRERKKSDRRKLFISLTFEGIQIAEKLKLAMNQYLKDKLEPLPEEDIEKFSNILDELWELNQKLISKRRNSKVCK